VGSEHFKNEVERERGVREKKRERERKKEKREKSEKGIPGYSSLYEE